VQIRMMIAMVVSLRSDCLNRVIGLHYWSYETIPDQNRRAGAVVNHFDASTYCLESLRISLTLQNLKSIGGILKNLWAVSTPTCFWYGSAHFGTSS
jgi:hypothetical protein